MRAISGFYIATARFEFKYTKIIDKRLEAWNAVMLHCMDVRFSKI